MKRRIEIYDRYAETVGRGRVKVAEAITDGSTGTLTVLDPKFEKWLTKLFCEPILVLQGGVTLDGRAADAAVELKPSAPETLQHVVDYGLRFYNLRGEVVEI